MKILLRASKHFSCLALVGFSLLQSTAASAAEFSCTQYDYDVYSVCRPDNTFSYVLEIGCWSCYNNLSKKVGTKELVVNADSHSEAKSICETSNRIVQESWHRVPEACLYNPPLRGSTLVTGNCWNTSSYYSCRCHEIPPAKAVAALPHFGEPGTFDAESTYCSTFEEPLSVEREMKQDSGMEVIRTSPVVETRDDF